MAVLTGGLLAAPLAAEAQQATKVPRVGFLIVGPVPIRPSSVRSMSSGMDCASLSYQDGQVTMDYRSAEAH